MAEDQPQEDLRPGPLRWSNGKPRSPAASSAYLFSAKVDGLHVDSKELFNEIELYLKQIDPELLERVVQYDETVPLFDKFDIENEIRDLFKARCDLPTGGYIIIQPTEALVSIDVNTGRYTGKKDPEKTILKTNLESAREIARQIRLRGYRWHHRVRFHRHGEPPEPRTGATGVACPPRPGPRPHQGLRRLRVGPRGNDPAAGSAIPLALHDHRVPRL